MNRRRFFQSIAAAATVPAFAAEAPWKLNYLLASSMYGSLPLSEILPEVKKTGATAIELWPKKHGTQREELDAMGHEKFGGDAEGARVSFGGTTRYDLGPFKLAEEIALVKKLRGQCHRDRRQGTLEGTEPGSAEGECEGLRGEDETSCRAGIGERS
jgi:hypothetical protein